jgi:soluble lytic murein transglycosylase-like protein
MLSKSRSYLIVGFVVVMITISEAAVSTPSIGVRRSVVLTRFSMDNLPNPRLADEADSLRLSAFIEERRPQLSVASRDILVSAILDSADLHGVDPKLVAAVIAVESGFDPRAYNHGAMGLGQLMRGTARNLGVEDPYSITQNVEGTTRYIVQMLDFWDGHPQQVPLALSSYLMGPMGAKRQEPLGFGKKAHDYVRSVLKRYKQILSKGSPAS